MEVQYGARNETSSRRRTGGIVHVLAYFYGVRGQMRRYGVPRHLRRPIYRAILRGFRFRPAIERA